MRIWCQGVSLHRLSAKTIKEGSVFVRIFNRSTVDTLRKEYPDADGALKSWLNIAKVAEWKNLADVQATYSNSAEAVGNFTVFNIKGNKYRLIVAIVYSSQTIFIKYFLTHADYDRGAWQNDPHF